MNNFITEDKTSLESDKPWPGSPFSVIWFKTRPGDLVVPDPFGR